jgi:hypothetical protein
MAPYDLSITFDRLDAVYRGGETVRGTVRVACHQDLDCRGVVAKHGWRTFGKGNTDRGAEESVQLAGPQALAAGSKLELPFAFQAPARPITYRSTVLQIEHQVGVELELPWARNASAAANYVLAPGVAPPELRDRNTQLARLERPALQPTGCMKLPVMLVMLAVIAALMVAVVSISWILIPVLAVIGVVAWGRKRALASRLDTVEVHLADPVVAPGESYTVSLVCVPRKTFRVQSIAITLSGREKATSGGGKSRRVHERALFTQRHELRAAGEVVAGQRLDLTAALPIPATDAFSLTAPNHSVEWQVELRIDMPWFPDWKRKQVLQVVPQEWVRGLASSAVGTAVEESETAEAARPVPSAPPAAEGEAVDLPPPTSIEALATALQTAGRDSARRNVVLEAAAKSNFKVTVLIERVTGTTTGRDLAAAYVDGKTLLGTLLHLSLPIEVATLFEQSDSIGKLRRGETWTGQIITIGWDSLYKRLRARQIGASVP